jgi:hypothetical protein
VPKPDARAQRIAQRIKRLVDESFDGNLSRASRELGVPYDALRSLYLGITRRPSIDLLLTIARSQAEYTPDHWLGD